MVYESIQEITRRHIHPISQNFLLVGNVEFISTVTLFYVLMSLYGPKVMASRKEFHLKTVIQCYNLFMILINAYIVKEILVTSWNKHWYCEPTSRDLTPEAVRHGRAIWIFYLTKLVEYCDTLFFILRKKFHNVNFIHVYHHASVTVYIWGVASFVPTGTAFVPCVCNAFVHVVIYSYYFLSALGPKYAKYLWWRNYLIQLRIFQFMVIMFLTVLSYTNGCNKEYYYTHHFLFAYMSSFVFLHGYFSVTQDFAKRATMCCPSQLSDHVDSKKSK